MNAFIRLERLAQLLLDAPVDLKLPSISPVVWSYATALLTHLASALATSPDPMHS
jgi:hypothetical protein